MVLLYQLVNFHLCVLLKLHVNRNCLIFSHLSFVSKNTFGRSLHLHNERVMVRGLWEYSTKRCSFAVFLHLRYCSPIQQHGQTRFCGSVWDGSFSGLLKASKCSNESAFFMCVCVSSYFSRFAESGLISAVDCMQSVVAMECLGCKSLSALFLVTTIKHSCYIRRWVVNI